MKILVTGDFCPQYRVTKIFEKGEYESVLGEVKNVVSEADYSIVNFECPVIRGGENPIEKCGPNLYGSDKAIDAVKWAGFNCLTLANNHILDYGKEGVVHTIQACEKYDIDTVGVGLNLNDASHVVYKYIKEKTLAIINCCEHEFSIATEDTAGSNPLNPIQQYYAIRAAKEKADFVLVIVHGGHELFQLPSLRMQEIYRFFIEAGADAVVNHHQHCFSGYEVYKNRPIFYGLGNFCFDNPLYRGAIWNEGFLLELNLKDGKEIDFTLHPYKQCDEKPGVFFLNNLSDFTKRIAELNSIIGNKNLLNKKNEEYYETTKAWELQLFEPYCNKILNKLFSMRLLPSLMTKKRILNIWNHIECESHRDKLIYAFKH